MTRIACMFAFQSIMLDCQSLLLLQVKCILPRAQATGVLTTCSQDHNVIHILQMIHAVLQTRKCSL